MVSDTDFDKLKMELAEYGWYGFTTLDCKERFSNLSEALKYVSESSKNEGWSKFVLPDYRGSFK